MPYRPEIDGLRALAVWAVVLFHVDVSWCSGGFVGVDIFFVISGYLLSSIAFRQIEEDRFSVLGFYERRGRRILPALLAVLAATTGIAVLVLPQARLPEYAESALATEGFFANLFFWAQSGYFDAGAATKPLLHMWSLGVEEQFYVLFPLLVLLSYRLWKRRSWLLLGGLFFASLVWSVKTEWAGGYFDPLSRGWELLLGTLLARAPLPRPGRRVGDTTAVVGLCMVGGAVAGYSGETPFPGVAALLPCVGTALILWGTQPTDSSVARWLGTPVFCWNGRVSYSLYLWHWPLLVFASEYLGPPLGNGVKCLCIAGALVAAAFSTRFLEQPLRRKGSTKRLFGTLLAIALALAVLLLWLRDRPPAIRTASESAAGQLAAVERARRGEGRLRERGEKKGKRLGVAVGAVQFALWGDSHAFVLSNIVDEIAERRGIRGRVEWKKGCPPLLGVSIQKRRGKCLAYNRQFIEFLRRTPSVRTVVIAARWAAAATGGTPPGELPGFRWRLVPVGNPGGPTHQEALFQLGLRRTIEELRSLGIEVVLFGPVPEQILDVLRGVERAATHHRALTPAIANSEFEKRSATAIDALRRVGEQKGVSVIWPHRALCRERCDYFRDGRLLYRDDDHLSEDGARLFVPQLEAKMFGREP